MNKSKSSIPSADECFDCMVGTYQSVRENYFVGKSEIKDLELRRCNECGHTILPWTSVQEVDKVLAK